MKSPLAPALIIGIVSFAGLSFEVTLTRLFSLLLYQDFVFLGISFAVLGLCLGAVLCGWMTRSGTRLPLPLLLSLYAFSLPFTFVLLTLLPMESPFFLWILFGLFSMPPFILMGMVNSYLYQAHARKSGLLYAFDTGLAAAGALLSIAGMNGLGPFQFTLLVALLPSGAASALFLSGARRGGAAAALGTSLLLFLAGFTPTARQGLDRAIFTRSVPGKALFDEVRKGAGVIEKTRWNSLGRLDQFIRNDYPAKFFYTDAAVPATMFQYSGNEEQMASYLRHFVCFAPFTYGPREKVLSIGSGGGMDCLLSHLGGAGDITAVEINGEMVRMAEAEAAYNGSVFSLPGVRVVVDEGRCFLRASRERYDLILLLLTQGNNAEAGGRVLTENYLMTREAFGEYYDRLGPGGRIVIAVHNPHRASRYLLTWAAMLRERGIDLSGAVRRFAMLSYPDAAYRFLCVFHRDVLSPEHGRILKTFADSTPAEPIYIPFVHEEDRDLGGMAKGSVSEQDFIRTSPNNINIAPVSDDRPFQNDVYYGVHPSLRRLFLLTLAVLLAVFLLSARFSAGQGRPPRGSALFSLYFLCIGAAFMMAEVVLIRKMMLYLGHPSLALSVVLFSILLGAGAGGFFQQRLKGALVPAFLAAAALLLAAHLPVSGAIMDRAVGLPVAGRGALSALLVFVPAFFMGTAFPRGLRAFSMREGAGAAWMWGVNGAAAVAGSLASMVLSLLYGTSAALWCAALLYAAAAVLLGRLEGDQTGPEAPGKS